MAITAGMYGLFYKSLATKLIDISADTFKMMLVDADYTPNKDTHQFKSDVTDEVTGTGVAAGGLTLAGATVSYDTATDTLKLPDFTDLAATGLTFTGARRGIVYDSTPGSDATRPLVGWVDFGQDISLVAGELNINWAAAGFGTLTVG
jgi:hypothetical protein